MKEKVVRFYAALSMSMVAAILILPLLFGFSEIVFLIFYGETPNLKKLFQAMLSVMKKCVPFVVLIGVPTFLLLRKLSHINYLKMGTAGFLLGLTIIIILTRPWNLIISENFPSFLFSASLLGGIPGMVSALIFYFVWHRIDSK